MSIFANRDIPLLIIDPETGGIIDANHAAANLYGYSREELLVLNIGDAGSLPKEEILKRMTESSSQQGQCVSLHFRRKDGNVREIEVTLGPVSLGNRRALFGLLRDVTEQMTVKRQLKASEERFRLLVESVKDQATFILDRDGRIVTWCDEAERINGYMQTEIVGQHYSDLFSDESVNQNKPHELLHSALQQGCVEWSGWWVRRDGAWYWASVTISRLLDEECNQYGYSVVLKDITESRRTEELLREREELYRTLIDTSPEAIVLFDTDSHILMANQQATALLGYEKKDDVLGGRMYDYLIPEDRQHIAERMRELPPKGSRDMRYTYQRRDGSRFVGEMSVSIINDMGGRPRYYIGIIADITERFVIEKKIRHTAEEWRTTFDSINDMIAILDKNMCVIRANKACSRLRGLSPKEMIGKACFEIFHYSGKELGNCLCRDVFTIGETQVVEYYEQRTDTHYELTVSPVKDAHDKVVAVVHIAKDITERKKLHDILQRDKDNFERLVDERTGELLAARLKLEQVKRLSDIGTLAATVAHELRNPLGVIRTALYNLRRKNNNAALNGHMANMEKKVLESDQIISNLLFYSRLKMPHHENVRICGILEECVDATRDRFHKWNVKIEKQCEHNAASIIQADPLQMAELFNNLLNNAYEAMTHKKGTITIKGGRDGNGYVWISIRDTGAGIDQQDIERITEPFFTRKSKGTGLGLAVCKQIVDLHGGMMRIESQKGAGTTVTVTLSEKRGGYEQNCING
jgi:PAS domain S-box-containing protein